MTNHPASAAPACAPAAAPPTARRAPYKIAGPQTWALARELYLAGLPAPEVARRLDVSEHNLRKKAWREGWSRRQHAERVLDLRLPQVGGDRRSLPLTGHADPLAPVEAPAPAPLDAAPAPDADPIDAADVLTRRAAGLALSGRAAEAGALLKVAEALRKACAHDEAPDVDEAATFDADPSQAEINRRASEASYAAMSELERAEVDLKLARLSARLTPSDVPGYEERVSRMQAEEARYAALQAAASELYAAATQPPPAA